MRKSTRGVTLVELAMIVGMLAIIGGGFVALMRIMTGVYRQAALNETGRDAEVHLYQIVKDVRNARYIVSVSSETLVLSSYNLAAGTDIDVNPGLLSDANVSTVTYRFHQIPGAGTFLRRTKEFNGSAESVELLKNQLEPVTDQNFLFENKSLDSVCPCDRVRVVFRFTQGRLKEAPRIYDVDAVVRSYVGI